MNTPTKRAEVVADASRYALILAAEERRHAEVMERETAGARRLSPAALESSRRLFAARTAFHALFKFSSLVEYTPAEKRRAVADARAGIVRFG